MKNLKELAQKSNSLDNFIFNVKQNDLLHLVYQWERETPEKVKKYKDSGWFSIAADFWEENKS